MSKGERHCNRYSIEISSCANLEKETNTFISVVSQKEENQGLLSSP